MTNKRQSITSDETKRYLGHACEAKGGRTAAKLAELLNVQPPRVTEGRKGEWCMTEQHKQLIIDNFGAPKGKPGTFVQAESHDSLDAFFDNEERLSRHRHLAQIAQIVNTKEFKQDLAKAVQWADETVVQIEEQGRPDSDGDWKEKLERLTDLMALPEFAQWLEGSTLYLKRLRECEEYRDDPEKLAGNMGWITSNINIDQLLDLEITDNIPDEVPWDSSLLELAKQLGIRIESRLVFPTLFLLGHLRHSTHQLEAATGLTLEQPYTPMTGLRIPAPSIIEDYVITGSCIFDDEGVFNTPKIGAPCLDAIFIPLWQEQPQLSFPLTVDLFDRYVTDTPKRSLSVDYWVSYRVAVYLKDNCDYALHLNLRDYDLNEAVHRLYQPLGRERNIVIPDIPAPELFKVLEELRKWLGMPELPLFELKSRIAQQGGYIPGARVI